MGKQRLTGQAAMKAMPRRAPSTRSSTAGEKNRSQQTSALNRALSSFEKSERQKFEAQQRKEANRHKFQTKADIHKKVSAQAAAGKIPRGQIKTTVERRWKATQSRQNKFKAKQAAQKTAFEKQLQDDKDNAKKDPGAVGVRMCTAVLTWQDSDDERETELTFPATPETLWADAEDALNNYRAAGNVHLTSVSVSDWDDLV